MQDLLIPGWFLYLAGGFFGWMIWMTMQIFDLKKNSALNKQDDQFVKEQLAEIKAELKSNNSKLDTFLKQEMDYLKINLENKK